MGDTMPGRKKKHIRHAEIVHRFADRLKELRHSQGMTQAELARASHVSTVYIGRLESGGAAPGIDLLDRIAKALSVSIADLLPSTPPPDTTAQLKERVRLLSERLVQAADRQTLSLAAQFLARLNETSP
jgi:transcriptional regulator with XRE-family HTH domain